MKGYAVVFKNENGEMEKTFLGSPMSSMKIKDEEGVVRMMFGLAHSGCEIVSMQKCDFDDWQNEMN